MTIALVALGNRLRQDDGVGPAILDCLAADGLPPKVSPYWFEHDLREVSYLEESFTRVIVLDAVQFCSEPGAICWLNVQQIHRSQLLGMHDLKLPDLLPTALVSRTRILGIQPANLELGLGLSPVVARASERASLWLRRYLYLSEGDEQHGKHRPMGTDSNFVGSLGGLWSQSFAGDRQGLGKGDHRV